MSRTCDCRRQGVVGWPIRSVWCIFGIPAHTGKVRDVPCLIACRHQHPRNPSSCADAFAKIGASNRRRWTRLCPTPSAGLAFSARQRRKLAWTRRLRTMPESRLQPWIIRFGHVLQTRRDTPAGGPGAQACANADPQPTRTTKVDRETTDDA